MKKPNLGNGDDNDRSKLRNPTTPIKKLNFGCGDDIRKGWDNVDAQTSPKLTKSFDFNTYPYPIKDNTYDYIYCNMVIEHMKEADKMVHELRRITKNKGLIDIRTPHYTNKGAYNDLQHKTFLNERAFTALAENRKRINKKTQYLIRKLEITPTPLGKLLPKQIREKLALFINGLLSQIHVIYEVRK